MQKDKALKLLGKHINIGCEDELASIIRVDVTFTSHRFMYKIQGKMKVVALLNEWMLSSSKTNAYESFYMTQDYTFKSSLQPCILLIGQRKNDFVSLLTVKMKRGKIAEITGLDPIEYSPTRGDMIL